MTTKRTQARRVGSAFVNEQISIDLKKSKAGDLEALVESLQAASPRGRVAKWKPHAERLGVGLDHLAKAERLIDGTGEVLDLETFSHHMAYAQNEIELAQVEETFVPLAVDAVETKKQRSESGKNSHGMRAADRRKRNEWIQSEINRLCLERGFSFKRACARVAETLPEELQTKDPLTQERKALHPDHIRKRIAKNPLA
jgi:hypothetical protein